MQDRNWEKTTPTEIFPLLNGFEEWTNSIGAAIEDIYLYVNSKNSVLTPISDKGCIIERKQHGRLNALQKKHGFKRLAKKLMRIDAAPVCMVRLSGPRIKSADVIVKPLQNEKEECDISKKAGELGIGPKMYATYKNKRVQMIVEEGLTMERLWLPIYKINRLPAVQFSRRIGELFGKLHHERLIYQDWQPNHVFYQMPSGRRLGKVKLVDFGSTVQVHQKYCDREKETIKQRVEDLLIGRSISNKETIKALKGFDSEYMKKR